MAESVYKVVELVGTSDESWEKAATAAVERAGKSLRDLRIAEVVEQDLQDPGRQGFGLPHPDQGLVQIRGRRLTGARRRAGAHLRVAGETR